MSARKVSNWPSPRRLHHRPGVRRSLWQYRLPDTALLGFWYAPRTYWCLVGNGWEWGNGMIITSDYGWTRRSYQNPSFEGENPLKILWKFQDLKVRLVILGPSHHLLWLQLKRSRPDRWKVTFATKSIAAISPACLESDSTSFSKPFEDEMTHRPYRVKTMKHSRGSALI
jgi:hypothetical protein